VHAVVERRQRHGQREGAVTVHRDHEVVQRAEEEDRVHGGVLLCEVTRAGASGR